MKIVLDKMIFVVLLIISSLNVFAQEIDNLPKALRDELDRNIDELYHPEFDRPFYISYQVDDYKNTSIAASLGGILNANVNRQRSVNGRVLVGGYDFNDESFASQNIEPYYGPDDTKLPLEDDYLGIRRSLWDITDKIYKTAGEIFEAHKKALESKGETIDETPHLKFSKETLVQQSFSSKRDYVSKTLLENKMREFSGLFLNYPEIEISGINLNLYEGDSYFVSSEGSNYAERNTLTSLFITAAGKDDEGNYVYSQSNYVFNEPKELFSAVDFNTEVELLSKELNEMQSAPKFDESYEGPVLFMADAIPSLFNNILYQFTPDASEPDALNDYNVDYGYSNSFASRLGKQDFQEELSIKLTPSLENYNGEKLLGAYKIDREGMTPKDEIVLVKEGVINELMVGRNYKSDEMLPTGTGSGLGVVHIDFEETKKKEAALKQMLIKEVKKRKLDYGLIIRKMNGSQQFNVYRVKSDGEEELYKWARLSSFDKKSLRKIMAVTESKVVINMPSQNGVTSYITPFAMLINDVDVEPVRMPMMKQDDPLVPSPLSLIKSQD